MLNKNYNKEIVEVFKLMKAEKEQEIDKDRLEYGKVTAEREYYQELCLRHPQSNEYKEKLKTIENEYRNFISKYVNDTENKHIRLLNEIEVLEDLIKKFSKQK